MHTEIGVPVSYMGIVSMIISGGTIISSLLSDRLTRKSGTRIVTVSSVFLTVIALLGFSFSDRFWMLIVFAVPYGLGAGAIDAALNNYVVLHYKGKLLGTLEADATLLSFQTVRLPNTIDGGAVIFTGSVTES